MPEFYGVTGARREVLMTLCGEARRRGWWHQFSGAIPAWFEVYVGIEGEVSEIRSYQPEAIDGRTLARLVMPSVTPSAQAAR